VYLYGPVPVPALPSALVLLESRELGHTVQRGNRVQVSSNMYEWLGLRTFLRSLPCRCNYLLVVVALKRC